MKFLTLRRKNFSHSLFGETRLAFNNDGGETPPEGGAGGTPPPADTPPVGGETPPKPANSAEARIKELNDAKKDAEAKAEKAQKELDDLKTKQKEETGKFKDLYEESKEALKAKDEEIAKLSKKTTAFEESIKKGIDAEIGKLSENDKKLVSDLLSGKELHEQQELLPALLKKFSTPADFGGDALGKKGTADAKARFAELNAKDKLTMEEEREFMKLSSEISQKK